MIHGENPWFANELYDKIRNWIEVLSYRMIMSFDNTVHLIFNCGQITPPEKLKSSSCWLAPYEQEKNLDVSRIQIHQSLQYFDIIFLNSSFGAADR